MGNGTGKKTMLLGALCCAAGITANAMTYSGAASTEELTYVVAWGAIIFGTIQIVRGAANLGPSNNRSHLGAKASSPERISSDTDRQFGAE